MITHLRYMVYIQVRLSGLLRRDSFPPYLFSFGDINNTAKTNGVTAVESGPAQQELGGNVGGLRSAVGVPAGPFGLIE